MGSYLATLNDSLVKEVEQKREREAKSFLVSWETTFYYDNPEDNKPSISLSLQHIQVLVLTPEEQKIIRDDIRDHSFCYDTRITHQLLPLQPIPERVKEFTRSVSYIKEIPPNGFVMPNLDDIDPNLYPELYKKARYVYGKQIAKLGIEQKYYKPEEEEELSALCHAGLSE